MKHIDNCIKGLINTINHVENQHLSRLERVWELYNKKYFDEKLKPIKINISTTNYGRYSVYFNENSIILNLGLFLPHSDLYCCNKFVDDVLLHEMIHQYQKEVLGNIQKGYNNIHWINEILRISKLIDCIPFKATICKPTRLPTPKDSNGNSFKDANGKIVPGKIKKLPIGVDKTKINLISYKDDIRKQGYLTNGDLENFPHSIRPKGYYHETPKFINY